MHPPLPGDKAAGFIGLVAGAVSIFVIVYVIVLLTNRSFESHGGAVQHAAPHSAPPAGAPAPSQPAGTAGTAAPAQH